MSLAILTEPPPSRTPSSGGPPAHTTPDGCAYRLELPGGPLVVHVDFERRSHGASPAWTALSCDQCPNCPLRDTPTCPAAADLAPVVEALGGLASVDRLDVVVTEGHRETKQSVTGESAARAIIGLVMATSACPILGRLRPLALLHLPFATHQESTFRFAAAHLLQQFFAGDPRDLDGLRVQMQDLHTVNAAFSARIRAACRKDAIPNALTALFSLSLIVEDEAEMGLAGLRSIFGLSDDASWADADP